MLRRIPNGRTLATIALAAAAAIGSVGGVSLAQGNGSGGNGTKTVVTQTSSVQPGGILAGVHDILARLVVAGTIDQRQADAVQAQADAGSIDPNQLVQSGVLSNAQMRAVGERIDQLKRSYGG